MYAMSVPTTKAFWGSYVGQVIETIGYIMRLPNPKLTQNGIYDHFCLAREWGFRPVNWTLDTLALSHCYHAAQWKHSLDYLASIHTDEPYWKDEAKESAIANQWAGAIEKFWLYNAKDSAVMYEIYQRLWALLEDEGRIPFYEAHYARLFEPLLTLSLHGMAVDDETRRRRLMDCQATCIALQDEVSRLAGMQLYATKSLSRARIKEYLYNRLHLPIRKVKDKKTGEKKVTCDEVTIRKYMLKFPKQVSQVGKMILDHTRIDTLSRFYKPERLDEDGRMRSEYWMNTEEGRLKSKKNALGTGANAQNVDRAARDVYLADPGCYAISIDYSQIESRIADLWLYHLSGNDFYLDRALSKPWERDQHHETAVIVQPHLDLDELKQRKDEDDKEAKKEYDKARYLGKKARHALPRGLGAETLQGELLKDGHAFDVSETKTLIDNLMKAEPEHRQYFEYIEETVKQERKLVNSWGRELKFPWDRVDGDGAHVTYQRGYSFHPQSECWDLLLQHGILPFADYLTVNPGRAKVNAYIHDEIFFSAERETAYETATWLRNEMERAHTIVGVEFSCYVSLTVGLTWEGEKEFKEWPSREEFEEVVRGLV
jgi:DNA polymerase I-like protein with 3'-5' exonuclease and polymerase domains